MVVRVLWSTKYGLPSFVKRCSHPEGNSPNPVVVAPLAAMLTAAPGDTGVLAPVDVTVTLPGGVGEVGVSPGRVLPLCCFLSALYLS